MTRGTASVWLVRLTLVSLVLAIYWQTLGFGFITLDDPPYVTANPWVQQGLSWDGLRWALTSFYAGIWSPLTWFSLMLDVEIAGAAPRTFHATNLLLHTASSLLLFQLLDRATGARWKSAWVAALFAVHPLHVESVAWIAERKDVLSALFWFLTMLLWLRWVERPGRLRYALVMGSFSLGLLSKPMLVTLPLVLLLFDRWPLGRQRGMTLGSLVWEKIPLLGLTVMSSAVTLIAAQIARGAVASLDAHPLGLRLTNAVVSYAIYLQQTFWPTGLAVVYPLPRDEVPLATWLPAALLLSAVCILVAVCWRSRPYLAVGWLWYLGTLVPTIGIVQVGLQARADRFTYLPLVGVFIMLAWGVPDLLGRLGLLEASRPSRRFQPGYRLLQAGASATVAGAAWLAYWQCGYWRDSVLLLERTLEVTGENLVAQASLAATYHVRNGPGDLERSLVHYAEVIRIDPESAGAKKGIADVLMRLGRVEEAIPLWSEVVRVRPQARGALCNLCVALSQVGRLLEAEKRCVEALRFKSQAMCAHHNLGRLYLQRERLLDAERHLDAALRIEPLDTNSRLGLGVVFMKQQRFEEARVQFLEVLRADPSNQAASSYLAAIPQRPQASP